MQWSPDFLNLLGKLTKTGLQNREAQAIGGKIFDWIDWEKDFWFKSYKEAWKTKDLSRNWDLIVISNNSKTVLKNLITLPAFSLIFVFFKTKCKSGARFSKAT